MPTAARTVSRRRVPRAERERQMLAVADEVFARRGFHAASMDEIAEAVGVSKPMLYSYFGSKEGLYLAVVRRAGEALLRRLRGAAGHESAHDRLAAGALAFFQFVDEHRGGWAVLHGEMAGRGPLRDQVGLLREQMARTVAALLVEGASDPDGLGDPQPLAHAVVGAGESLASWWLAHPDEPAARMADRLVSVVWTGLEGALRRRAAPTSGSDERLAPPAGRRGDRPG